MLKKILLFFLIFPLGVFVIVYVYGRVDHFVDNKMEGRFIDFIKSNEIGKSVNLAYFINDFNIGDDGYFCIVLQYENRLKYKNNPDVKESMYPTINKKLDDIGFRDGFLGLMGYESKWGIIFFGRDFRKFQAYEISNNKVPLVGHDDGNCFALKKSFIYKEVNDRGYQKNLPNYGLKFSSKLEE